MMSEVPLRGALIPKQLVKTEGGDKVQRVSVNEGCALDRLNRRGPSPWAHPFHFTVRLTTYGPRAKRG